MALPKVRAAACHFAPMIFEARKSCEKAIGLIHEAAHRGANLVVFPESAIPGFPIWSALLPPTRTHDFFQLFAQSSLLIDGEEISAIRHAAAKSKVIVSLGFSEKVRYSTGTLFNTNILIGEQGELLIHHRKLVPTFFEKLSWSPGDGYGLRVANTKFGKIGALICGENTNPLARYALMAQGEQIHISTWPAVWPTRDLHGSVQDNAAEPPSSTSKPSTNRHDGQGQGRPDQTVGNLSGTQTEEVDRAFATSNYDNTAANRTRAAAHCFEAKSFGISCAGHLDQDMVSRLTELVGDADGLRIKKTLDMSQRATTQFFDPTGRLLQSFNYNHSHDKTDGVISDETPHHEIHYADLDLNQCVEGKQYHDVVGGYQRFDVFSLTVNRQRSEPATFVDSGLKTSASPSRGAVPNGHPTEAQLGINIGNGSANS
ncbi:hypothetical protein LTR84_004899 [Exophiala bonariae]|uniref:CN hydrolase domain-containing protein n=1 Tax=Exophiala bonariae TaxID=1690606 RepID=A0AAV9NRQ9_9EURO|nr:hypothetical protein LTR84_004899 [Exophiala bonariae]